jgi:hypothetical protein
MPTTIDAILEKSGGSCPSRRPDCLLLYKYVPLICCVSNFPDIKLDQRVHASRVDRNGENPNRVYLKEMDGWIPVDHFDLEEKGG